MSKQSQLDKILLALRSRRDLLDRSIKLVEDERAALAAKPKRVRRPRLVEGTAS